MTKPSLSKAAADLSTGPRGQPINEVLGRAGEACLDACQNWHTETSSFLLKRFDRDAELARRLLECRDWSHALRLQQEWASAAVQDYLEHTQRTAEMAGKLWTLDRIKQNPAAPDRPTDVAAQPRHVA